MEREVLGSVGGCWGSVGECWRVLKVDCGCWSVGTAMKSALEPAGRCYGNVGGVLGTCYGWR